MRNTSISGLARAFSILLVAGLAAPLAAAPGFGNREVIEMTAAGLSEDLVLKVIFCQDAGFDVTPQALIELRRGGVSETVLEAMMSKVTGRGTASPWGIEVPDGTEVRLRLKQSLSSATAKERELLLFETVADVKVGGVTVIAGGAEGRGTVVRAQHRKSFGRRGELELSFDTVEAVDGQAISLRAERSHRGDERYGTAGVVTLLVGPFGAFVKGKDIEVPAGTEYTIYIDGERRVASTAAFTGRPLTGGAQP